MKVIIAGAGEIGRYVAEMVSADGYDVTIIDNDREKFKEVTGNLDVQAINGSAALAKTLTDANVAKADLLAALTGSDETNLVCASIAGKLGAKKTLARVDEVVYRKAPEISYEEHFNIDHLVSPETLTALEMAAVVRNPGVLAVEHFAHGALEMQQLVTDEGAKFVGKPLRELLLPEGVRVASIHRADELIVPMGNDIIKNNDLITILGKTEQVTQARSGFETGEPKTQKIIIMGGGHTTLSLARRLRSHAFKLTIMEKDETKCQMLANRLPAATILHGDGTNMAFLKEERIDNAGIFISTTNSDEANILGAIQAKHLGAKKVLVMIHRPDYADLMEKIGIDKAVSPRVVMAHEILSLLREEKVSTLAIIDDGKAEILQMTVTGQDVVGKSLAELKLPEGALVLTLQRGKDVSVPNALTAFKLNDTLLVMCLQKQRKKIVRMIAG